jgi:predicted kinase
MEAIIFIGIQGTGKSTFYKENFFNSHIRISLDLLNTRNKQNKFLNTCFETQSRFVIDNTSPEIKDREPFIERAKERKYKVIGYYFRSNIIEAIERNSQRIGKEKIPVIGIKGCYNKLELPDLKEGFDELYYVEIINGQFKVSEWKNEI